LQELEAIYAAPAEASIVKQVDAVICHFANYLAELCAGYLAYRYQFLAWRSSPSGAAAIDCLWPRSSRVDLEHIRGISDQHMLPQVEGFRQGPEDSLSNIGQNSMPNNSQSDTPTCDLGNYFAWFL